MIDFVKGFIPGKATMIIIAILLLAIGYLFVSKKILSSEYEVANQKRIVAEEKLKVQEATIKQMVKDQEVQQKLISEVNKKLNDIRIQSMIEMNDLDITDFPTLANQDKQALEEKINDDMKRRFNSISNISKGALNK